MIESDTGVIDEKGIYHTQYMLIYKGCKKKSDRVTVNTRKSIYGALRCNRQAAANLSLPDIVAGRFADIRFFEVVEDIIFDLETVT